MSTPIISPQELSRSSTYDMGIALGAGMTETGPSEATIDVAVALAFARHIGIIPPDMIASGRAPSRFDGFEVPVTEADVIASTTASLLDRRGVDHRHPRVNPWC